MGLTLGSLFDGVGGWLLAAERAGVKPIWSSEIDPFAERVTKKHFPEVKQLGDIKKLNGATIQPVDIITSGSPCQSLSVAGKREGLDGESGLFKESTRILHEMRKATNGESPRFFVWENVTGAFSSNRGQDFKTVLEEITETEIPMPSNEKWANAGMVQCDGCEVAWRVLDAQYHGTPQRRKRIFLVADFRGQSATEILFESESVSRDSTESGAKREDTTPKTQRGSTTTIYDNHPQDSRIEEVEKSPTVTRRWGTGGGNVPLVLNTQETYDVRFTSEGTKNSRGHCYETSISRALDTAKQDPSTNHGGVAIVNNIGFDADNLAYCIAGNTIDRKLENGANGTGIKEEVSYTLNTIDRHAVYSTSKNHHHTKVNIGIAGSLVATDYKDPPTVFKDGGLFVRRLTPLECERLQGYPEIDGVGWTDIEGASDTVRYKAIGNGMAQPCADFVIHRIALVSELYSMGF